MIKIFPSQEKVWIFFLVSCKQMSTKLSYSWLVFLVDYAVFSDIGTRVTSVSRQNEAKFVFRKVTVTILIVMKRMNLHDLCTHVPMYHIRLKIQLQLLLRESMYISRRTDGIIAEKVMLAR